MYFRNSKFEITVKLAAMFLDYRIPKVKLLLEEEGVTLLASSVELVTQRSLRTLSEATGRPGNEHLLSLSRGTVISFLIRCLILGVLVLIRFLIYPTGSRERPNCR